ncbi:MAG: AsmA family protein [Mariprofundales bacterium]
MWKLIKVVGVLLVLVVAGLLAAPFFINVNDYRQEISSKVEQATGRTFTIGAIHASLFPWIGVELKDVHMANAIGFSGPDFLRVGALQVQLELAPLLHKEVVIHSFHLIKPEIYLARNARGESNWQDLTGSAVGSAPSAKGVGSADEGATRSKSGLFSLVAQSMVISKGHIGWRDGAGHGLNIEDVDLTITDLQQVRPVSVALSARIGADRLKLAGKVGPLGEDLAALDPAQLPMQMQLSTDHLSLATFKSLTGALPEFVGNDPALALDLQLEQRPDGVRVTAGTMSLSTAAPALFQQLQLVWKAEVNAKNQIRLRSMNVVLDQSKLATLSGTVTRLEGDPMLALRIQSAPLSRLWLAHFAPALTTLYAAHPAPWKQLRFGLLLRGTSSQMKAEDLQLVLDGESLQGEGSFRFGKEPMARLNLNGQTLHLDPWLPMATSPATSPASDAAGTRTSEGAVIGTSSAPAAGSEPDLRPFAKWKLDMRLSLDRLNMRKLDLDRFRVVVTGKRGAYRLKPLSFALAGGTVVEQATININHYPLRWTEALTVQGVQVQPVLKALADTDMLSGSLKMQTTLRGRGVLPDHATSRLNGSGKMELTSGSIKGFDIAGTLRNLTSFQQQGGSKQTDFSKLTASFGIVKGMVENKDLFMASPLFRLTGHGTVNLPAKTLDYHVKPKLVGTLIGQGDTMAVRKGLSVPVAITGSFNNPKIRPEIDPMTLIKSVGGLLKGGAGSIGGVLKGVGKGAGTLIQGAGGGVGSLLGGVGGLVGGALGGKPAAGSTPRGATIQGATPQGATIQPRRQSQQPATIVPNASLGGARIAPKAAPPPSNPQQQLQNALGGLLKGF